MDERVAQRAGGATVFAATVVAALTLVGPRADAASPDGPPTADAAAGEDPASEAARLFGEAVALEREHRFSEACPRFARAVELTPAFALARFELAQCLRMIGDLDGGAEGHLAASAAGLPAAPVLVERGRLAEDRGAYPLAISAYREALVAMPAEARAIAGLARLAEGRAGLPRAQAFVDANPFSVAGWRKLAEVAEAARRYPLAEQALVEVVKLSSNKRAAAAALGAFGQRTGRASAVAAAARVDRGGRAR